MEQESAAEERDKRKKVHDNVRGRGEGGEGRGEEGRGEEGRGEEKRGGGEGRGGEGGRGGERERRVMV